MDPAVGVLETEPNVAHTLPFLGGNAPEDHGCGLLDGFQALAQKIGVSVPKLDVVSGSGSGLESYRLADDKCDGLGFSLSAAL